MTNADHLLDIPQSGRLLGLTDRRVRQFIEAGAVPRLERGMVDFGWLLHYYGGTQVTEDWRVKPHANVLVAMAWMTGQGADFKNHLDLLTALFERNAKSRDDAMLALGQAMALMGR